MQPAHAATLDGEGLGWLHAVPFIGLLLTIALGPLLFSRLWDHHYGKIAAGWAAISLGAIAWSAGFATAAEAFVHAILTEYLSFIVLLFALYTVAGGVLITGQLKPTAMRNAAILAIGTTAASVIGTTGAAMILVRPLIRANAARRHRAHVIVFFIILVANVGGALSPLGDPPLFIGFLQGVGFFWPLQHIWIQTGIVSGLLLAAFILLDLWLSRNEEPYAAMSAEPIRIRGAINFLLIAVIIAAVLLCANWRPGVRFDVLGTEVLLQNLVRDGVLVLAALASLWLTAAEHRHSNGFTWEPIREVAKLFAAIFVAIIPVLVMLDAGRRGAFAPLLTLISRADGTPNEVAYFWLTGLLSAFLDNAPTYLIFFKLAGGDPVHLMGDRAGTLAAIAMGAVYMGALTYIGNAPNLMIRAIASESGIKMPSFFAYFFWASAILIPLFLLLTFLPVAPMLRFG